MLTRNLCSVMCIVALLLMGATTTNDSTKGDKALIDGDCKCVEEDCPGKIAGTEVACKYHSETLDPKWQECTCPWEEYKFFTHETPRKRICDDGPSAGDKSCECKCEGTKAPGCEECLSTCDSVDAVAPDDDPCPKWKENPYACGQEKCSPKKPTAEEGKEA